MVLVLTSGPSVEPISLTEAKAFLRVDDTNEDTLISSLITASRIHVEVSLGQGLITQNWSYLIDAWPSERDIFLPIKPVQSISEIVTYDNSDVATIYAASNYTVDKVSDMPRVVLKHGAAAPVPIKHINGIEVKMVVGYGAAADTVPEPIRQALKLLVTHWFENREPVMFGNNALHVPNIVEGLLGPYTRARLA
ncbi:MAG: head-tail connector protein [Pseudomonadota bacterium]